MERRQRGTGQVTHIECRWCASPMPLDPTTMEIRPGGPVQACPACTAEIPVRYSDQFRTSPPGDLYGSLRSQDRTSGLFGSR